MNVKEDGGWGYPSVAANSIALDDDDDGHGDPQVCAICGGAGVIPLRAKLYAIFSSTSPPSSISHVTMFCSPRDLVKKIDNAPVAAPSSRILPFA